ncbi:uncharacterized protein LOC111369112 [Olea europaea var. sylvestris]|uniref:uncharacterized protein LOC111369112 n=1 Tax=Olea europaea var. sylvestris TaxID=158386 RepID=UPI000C1CDD65|nr:uncharacterized protein LOC111369112 [Olea europaea var. sylvestris]
MVMQAIVIYNELRRRARHLPRAPHTNWNSEREITLTQMFGTSDTICRDLLRMKIGPFQRLCARLRSYGLVDSKYVRIEEQVAIFLNTVGHDQRNRAGRFTFFRSGQTVSFYFHRVLHACLGLYRDVVINATPHNSPYEKENVQPWYSFFQDVVGAIDGTHIATYVPLEEQGKYRNRKQVISQNVLVACTFDMKFTYVLAGWEGSAHDGRFSAAPFRVPRPTLHSDVEEISSTQADPNSRNRQIRWSDAMDGCMITALLHQVLSSHKRSDNGFSSYHVSKAIENVHNGCGVMVSDKNVRARLKTLKKEYVEVRQLLSMSGFGLDPHTGRVTADVLAWEELLKIYKPCNIAKIGINLGSFWLLKMVLSSGVILYGRVYISWVDFNEIFRSMTTICLFRDTSFWTVEAH